MVTNISLSSAAPFLVEEGKNGYLIDPHNPEKLAKKITSLLIIIIKDV